MYNQETQDTKKISPLLAGFLIAQIIFLILLAFTLPKLFESNDITFDQDRLPSASISNLGEYLPDLDSEGKKNFENTLYSIILANTPDQSVLNSETKATFLENTVTSLHFNRLGGINYFSAVIDIPDLEQSYDFYYGYPDDEEDGRFQEFYSILCPGRPEAKIYPDFQCNESSTDNQPQTHLGIASSFITFYPFEYFSVSVNPSMRDSLIISPISFDIDEATSNSYIEEVKAAVQALGFSPDLFSYYVTTTDDITYIYTP